MNRDSAGDPPRATRIAGLDQTFDGGGLVALRSSVSAHGDRLGLAEDRLSELLLIAHELASNAIIHGGGRGRLLLWRVDRSVYCRVQDWGDGFAEQARHAGWLAPAVGAANGRGLWLVRQLADDVDIRTGAGGTSVTIRVDI